MLITDVQGSTKAIEQGKYKDVNTAGGLAVVAIANMLKDMEFPFVFGGDGTTMLVPGQYAENSASVLSDTAAKVQEIFGLNLRVGAIPISAITSKGYSLTLARYKVSDYYTQAILGGEGASFAEDLLKSPEGSTYSVAQVSVSTPADFTGFTCRWQEIPSHKDLVLAIIIKPRGQNTESVLMEINRIIESSFGAEEDYHPLRESSLNVTGDPAQIGLEVKVVSGYSTGLLFWFHWLRVKMETLFAKFFMKFNIPMRMYWYRLNNLKKYQVMSSDFRKFDGTLKMVLASSTKAAGEFRNLLDQLKGQGKIWYGLHSADKTLMTCLLNADSEREVHFIDVADGGYALAAKMMKESMK